MKQKFRQVFEVTIFVVISVVALAAFCAVAWYGIPDRMLAYTHPDVATARALQKIAEQGQRP